MTDHSKNKRAEKLMGRRRTDAIVLDQPCELGYHCPVCEYPQMSEDGQFYDERLQWSEYNAFIWCEVCNFDYPSALCMPDPKVGTGIFLDSIADALGGEPEGFFCPKCGNVYPKNEMRCLTCNPIKKR